MSVVTTDGQEIRVRHGDGNAVADGQAVTALIRPEQFSLVKEGGETQLGAIDVEVEQIVFTGLNHQVHGRTNGNRKVMAIVSAAQPREIADVERDRKARFTYDPATVHLIAATEAGRG